MKNENGITDSPTRRSLLGQAAGAAGVLSALGSAGQVNAQAPAQTPPAGGGRGAGGRGGAGGGRGGAGGGGRGGMGGGARKSTFDFGWKFLKADVPGARQTNFADASWRDVDLPHDWSIEGPFRQDPGVERG